MTSLNPRVEATIALTIAVLTTLLFSPAIGGGFVHDDSVVILQNPDVHGFADWQTWFTGSFWPLEPTQGLYRPIVLASHALNWALVGPQAWLFRLTNVLLHALVSALVWWVARRTGLSWMGALVAAGLFAVHPVHAEVISGIVNRTDSMVAVPMLVAVGLHLGRSEDMLRWRQTVMVAVCYALALGCKENALVLPGLLVSAEFTLRRHRWRLRENRIHLMALGAVMVVITALYFALVLWACGRFGVPPERHAYPDASLAQRLPATLWSIGQCARLLLWPMSLCADYRWPLPDLTAARLAISILALSCIALAWAVALVQLWRPQPRMAFSLLWIAMALAPHLHIIPFGAVLGERFLYLASVGICLLIGGLFDALPKWRTPLLVATLLMAALFAGRAVSHTMAWKSQLTLWETTVASGHTGPLGWMNLGLARSFAGDARGGIEALRMAQRLDPDEPKIRLNLAGALLIAGETSEAERVAREAWERWNDDPDLAVTLGIALRERGRLAESAEVLESASEAFPRSADLWLNLAITQHALRRNAQARASMASAEAIGIPALPNLQAAHRALSEALQTGQP